MAVFKDTMLIFMILIFTSIYADEWPSPKFSEVIQPVAKKCIADVGLDENILNSVKKGDIIDDSKLKEYLACIFKTFDLIDYKHHEFEYWKILSMLPQEMKKPVFEMGKGCTHINGEDYGKACLEFIKCLHKANPERFAFMI